MIALMWAALGSLATLTPIIAVHGVRKVLREGAPWNPRQREHAERAHLTGPVAPALTTTAFFAAALAVARERLDATPLAEIQRQRDARGIGDLGYADRPPLASYLSDETLARGVSVAALKAAVEEYGHRVERAGEAG